MGGSEIDRLADGPLDLAGPSLVGPQRSDHVAHDLAEEDNRPRLIRQVQTDP
jgi:hypothetical protein